METEKPFVSFIIPTYNAEKYLRRCLDSIFIQDYPKDKFEVLISDGNSNDATLEIVKKYDVKVFNNLQRNCDFGKFIALEHARGEVIALIDSDNIIASKTWLRDMVRPFIQERDIIGVESNYLIANDFSSINTYVNLLGIVDPLARMLASSPKVIKKDSYLIKEFKKGDRPVAGANGFLWKKSIIDKYLDSKLRKFTEANLLSEIASKEVARYANIPNVGIYHYYCITLRDYLTKRIKIANKFLERKGKKEKVWVDGVNTLWFFASALFLVSIVGPLIEAILGFLKNKKFEWLWHPLVCLITVVIYAYFYLASLFKNLLADSTYENFILDKIKNKIVLDIGSIGHNFEEREKRYNRWVFELLLENSKDVYGIDNQENEVKKAQEKGYQIFFGDAQNFNLNKKFEVIMAGDIIEHLSNPGLFLNCCKFHLEKNGVFLISTPNTYALSRLFRVLTGFTNDPTVNKEHTFYFTPRVLDELLGRYGFFSKETKYTSTNLKQHGFGKIMSALNRSLCFIFGNKFKENFIRVYRAKEDNCEL